MSSFSSRTSLRALTLLCFILSLSLSLSLETLPVSFLGFFRRSFPSRCHLLPFLLFARCFAIVT